VFRELGCAQDWDKYLGWLLVSGVINADLLVKDEMSAKVSGSISHDIA
jgi:hypothetical protein